MDTISGWDVLVFFAEMAVYAAVAALGWSLGSSIPTSLLWSGLGVVVMATWWGALHSPKAKHPVPRRVDLMLRSLWFTIGAVAAAAVALLEWR